MARKTDFKKFETCSNCVFWDGGLCRKNAPSTRVNNTGTVTWPPTKETDKCGQFSLSIQKLTEKIESIIARWHPANANNAAAIYKAAKEELGISVGKSNPQKDDGSVFLYFEEAQTACALGQKQA